MIRTGIFFRSGTRRLSLLAGFLFFLTGGTPADHGAAGDEPRRVLLISSYHHGLSWADGITEAIQEEFASENVNLHVEYLDSKRYPLEEVSGPFYEFLLNKYADKPVDVILVADNNALTFLRDRRAGLFPDTPIIFCGINNFTPEMLEGLGPDVTGVVEISDPLSTGHHALRLLPGLKRLAIVSGITTTAINVREEARIAMRPLEDRLELLWWDGLETEELIGRLETLGPGDAVLLVLYNRDGAGRYYSNEAAGRLVDSHSPVPVFGLWDFYMGTGVVGGRLINARDQGTAAAGLAQTILRGIPASRISVVGASPNRDIFDYEALVRRGLSRQDLPSGATLLNAPDDSIREYLVYLFVCLALACVVFLLFVAFQIVGALARRRGQAPRFSADINRLIIAIPLVAILLASLLWAAQDYIRFRQDTWKLRGDLLEKQKTRVAHEVDRAVDEIAFLRETEQNRQRERIRERVDFAESLARDLSEKNAGRSAAETENLVADVLSSFRWDGGAGYYFALDETGVFRVHPVRPEWVGKSESDWADPSLGRIVREMFSIASQESGGFITYDWPRGEESLSPVPKLSYVRALPSSGWIIGAGSYLMDLREGAERMVLRHLESISFGEGAGALFVQNTEGTLLADRERPESVGRNFVNRIDANGVPVTKEMLAAAKRPGGGFVSYVDGEKDPSGARREMLAYVRGIDDWGWIVGTDFPISDLDEVVEAERRKMLAGFVTRLLSMIGAMLALGLLSLALGRRFSRRLGDQIEAFERGFGDAAREDRTMDETAFHHAEIRKMTRRINEILAARNLAREELRLMRERLELAMDAAEHGFWDCDIESGNAYFSPRYYTMLGYEPGELPMRFQTWIDLLHPEDREWAVPLVVRNVEEGKPFQAEFRLRTKDGGWRWISGRGKGFGWDHDTKPRRVVGVHVDVTERKEAEEELLRSREKFRSLFEQSNDAVFLHDLQGNILDANERAVELLGYDREELLRTPLARLHSASERESSKKALDVTKKKGGITFESRFLAKDGDVIDVEISARVTDRERGIVQGIARDITERKRAEAKQRDVLDEMKRLNDHLELQTARANDMAAQAGMASAAKSEFLARMSHEIRTPMNGVIGMVTLLLHTDLSEEQRRYAETVQASGEALLTLINDILDFSKIEAGKMEIETVDFDLHALLDDFLGLIAVKAAEKGLEFVCFADPEVPGALRGDPGRLRQVLLNLAGNAVKFTGEGEVAVRTRLEEETEREAVLRFTVRDTGIGIPKEKQKHLFQSFQQIDPSNTRKYGGTGLGLAISKNLIEIMGGSIDCESEEGMGTEFGFSIRFPKQEKRAPLPAPAGSKGTRILVTENHATNREVLVAWLRAWGMRAEGAADGAGALKLLSDAAAEGDPYRAVIAQESMHDLDGDAFGRAVRADHRLSEVAMALMRPMSRNMDERGIEGVGWNACLVKPVRRFELFACVEMLLGSRVAGRGVRMESSHPSWSGGKKTAAATRILLVEDNPINQQVAIGILGKLGYGADLANNGREAIRALEKQQYDLVLMDVQMPEMDGWEATAEIRNPLSSVRDHEIPVIAMTAHAMKGDREKCLSAGMNDYMTKPIRPEVLMDVLIRWGRVESGRIEAEEENGVSRVDGAGECVPPCVTDDRSGEPSHPEKGPAHPVFDREAFLERVMDDPNLAKVIVESFLKDVPERLKKMEEHLAEGDVNSAERQAHSIKGAAANVGGEALREVAFTIEKSGRAGDLASMRDLFPGMIAEFERFRVVALETV
ncbi:MAG: cache domain-containing protein [Candidatus Eisenbacteria bacterium]|nr:cache domain-containing protein [Candidatus Eisenbacteria bacterium]